MAKEIGIKLSADAAGAVKAFDDTRRAMGDVSKLAKQLTVDGKDTKAILAEIGDKGGVAFEQLIQKGQQEGKTLRELKQDVINLANQQSQAAKQQKSDAIAAGQAAANNAITLQAGLGPLKEYAAQFVAFTDGAKRSAAEVATMKRELGTVVKDKEQLAALVEGLERIGLTTKASREELTLAAKALINQKVYSEDLLKASLDFAAGTNKSAQESAQLFAILSRGGDVATRALKALGREGGISLADLQSAGAPLRDGKLFTGTPEAAQKVREALIKITEAKFPDAAQAAMSGTDKFNKELERFQASAGTAALAIDKLTKGSLIELLHLLNQMPEGMKAGIGLMGSLGSKAVSLTADTTQFLTNLTLMSAAAPLAGAQIKNLFASGTGLSAMAGGLSNVALFMASVGTVAAMVAPAVLPFLDAARKSTANLTYEVEQSQRAWADMETRSKALQQSRVDDWAKTGADSLHSMGVSSRDVSTAYVGLTDQLEQVRNSHEETFTTVEMVDGQMVKVVRTKAEYVSALERERAQLHATGIQLSEYEKVHGRVIANSKDAAAEVDRTTAAYARQAASYGAMRDALSQQIPHLQEDVDNATNEQEKEAATKRLEAAKKALFDLENSYAQRQIANTQAVAAAESNAAKMAVTEAQQALREKEMASRAAIADRLAVVDAEQGAAAKERDQAMQVINDRQQAEVNAHQETAASAQKYTAERENVERQYNDKVAGLAERRVQIERDAQMQMLGFVRQRLQEQMQADDDQMRLLEARRKTGVDTTQQELAVNQNKTAAMIADENKLHAINMQNAKSEAEQRNENARHRSALAHIAAQDEIQVLDIQARGREAEARALEDKRGQVNAEKEGVETQIELLNWKREHGVAVEREMGDAIKQRTALTIQSLELERDSQLKTEQNAERRSVIEAKAQADINRARVEGDLALAKNHEAEMARQQELRRGEEQILQLQMRSKDQEISALEHESDAGISGQSKLQAAIEERRDMAIKASEAARDAAIADAEKIQDAQLKSQKVAEANLKANNDRNAAEETYLGQLERQLSKLKEQEKSRKGSPLQTMEQAFGAGTSGFSFDSFSNTDTSGLEAKIRATREKLGKSAADTAATPMPTRTEIKEAVGGQAIKSSEQPGAGTAAADVAGGAAAAGASSASGGGASSTTPSGAAPGGTAAASGSTMRAGSITIHAQSVTVNGGSSSGTGSGMDLARGAFFGQ